MKKRGERSEVYLSASCTSQRGSTSGEVQNQPLFHLFYEYSRVKTTDDRLRPIPEHSKLEKYVEEIYFIHGHVSTE